MHALHLLSTEICSTSSNKNKLMMQRKNCFLKLAFLEKKNSFSLKKKPGGMSRYKKNVKYLIGFKH